MHDDIAADGDGLANVSDLSLHALDELDSTTLTRELRRFLTSEHPDSEAKGGFNAYIDP